MKGLVLVDGLLANGEGLYVLTAILSCGRRGGEVLTGIFVFYLFHGNYSLLHDSKLNSTIISTALSVYVSIPVARRRFGYVISANLL